MKTAFFVSTGRTGTDFFTALFNEVVQNTWSLHEPKPAFRRKASKLISQSFSKFDAYYFKLPRVYRHAKQKEEWYVETNYHLFAAVPLIRHVFKNALIFHIIRDGREVVTSWLNRYRYITNDYILPFDVPQDEAQEIWADWNPLQKITWCWKTINNHLLTTPADMIVRFEDLFRGDKKVCFDILEKFDNIEFDEQKIKNFIGKKINPTYFRFFPTYGEWPEKWKEQFWDIAGDTMEHFGYRD